MIDTNFDELEDLLDSDEVKSKVEMDSLIVKQFCEKYTHKLVKICVTTENTPAGGPVIFEPMYYFDNDLGGYTRMGIEESLKEE